MDAIETANRAASIDIWPPYDIVKSGEDEYRITMAVAGFSEEEMTIAQEQNVLLITGQKASDDNDKKQYLHRGIACRAFKRRFDLADHVHVVGARLMNGLLTVELKLELPEEMKPRRIAIGKGEALPQIGTSQIETKQIGAKAA